MPFHLDDRFWILDSGEKSKIYNLKSKILKVKLGFTLIELLIVIAILGILATIAVFSLTNAQMKGRDSKRKADLLALRHALELAMSDSSGSSFYPGCDTTNPCSLTGTSTNPDLSPSYISKAPGEPFENGTCSGIATFHYSYCYTPNSATGSCIGNYCARTYTLRACLENSNEPLGNYVKIAGSTQCPSQRRLLITEP